MPNLRFCPHCTGSGNGRWSVDYGKIMQAFTDAGIFGPDIHRLGREMKDMAEHYAPVRTGRLKKYHYINIQPPRGYVRTLSVGNKVGYARFVLGGTSRIYAKGDEPMVLRPQPYSWFRADSPGRRQMTVAGQTANNWLMEGMKQALRNRGLRVR